MKNTKWVLAIIFIAIIFTTCYLEYSINSGQPDQLTETVEMALLMIGGLGIIVTLLQQSESIRQNTEQIESRLKFDKIENTFELIRAWDNPDLLQARKLTRETKKKGKNYTTTQLVKKISSNPELEHSVLMTSNYWEGVILSIENDRVDEKMLKRTFKITFCDMYKRFEPWYNHKNTSIDTATKKSLKDLYKRWS